MLSGGDDKLIVDCMHMSEWEVGISKAAVESKDNKRKWIISLVRKTKKSKFLKVEVDL